jgi:hypothetical protein
MVTLLAACKVTVNDFEKWRNRERSEAQFVEWMLDPEVGPEIRQKAIEMLFEQCCCSVCEGADFLPEVAKLPQAQRDRAILDAVPRITELYEGATFSLGSDSSERLRPEQVRDSVITLMETTETPEVHQALMQIVIRWVEDYYTPCVTSIGRHPNWRILNMVGPERGLPVVTHFIREGDSFDDIICQNSYLRRVVWMEPSRDLIASAYIERWQNDRPETAQGQLDLVEAMISVPDSQVLKNWMFQEFLDPDEELTGVVVNAFFNYLETTANASDAPSYARIVEVWDGTVRWVAFERLLDLGGAEGLDLALSSLPVEGDWERYAGRRYANGLERASEYLCDRPRLLEWRDEARQVLERHLTDENPVSRAIALDCLKRVGTEASLEAVDALVEEEAVAVIPAWSPLLESEDPELPPPPPTIGQLAAEVADHIRNPPPPEPEPEPDGEEGAGTVEGGGAAEEDEG